MNTPSPELFDSSVKTSKKFSNIEKIIIDYNESKNYWTLSSLNHYFFDMLAANNEIKDSRELKEKALGVVQYLYNQKQTKHSLVYKPEYLWVLTKVFEPDELNPLIKKHGLNYHSLEYKKIALNQYFKKTFGVSLESFAFSNQTQLASTINMLKNFINEHKIPLEVVSKFCSEKDNVLPLLCIKSDMGGKIGEFELKQCFTNCWKMANNSLDRFFIFEEFFNVFKETPLFKHTFQPMKKMDKKIYQFFNINALKIQRNYGPIVDYEPLVKAICNSRLLYKENITLKLQNADKMKLFNTTKLNETQELEFKEWEKKKTSVKKVKI